MEPFPVQEARDPVLVRFEEFLLNALRQSDICKDNQGIYMFNVNQAAYVVEDSIAEAQQRATRTRMIKDSINVVRKKCPRTGHGKPSHHLFA
jgi:hypothetical protein